MYDNVVIIGVLASLLFSELTGLSAGLVVPGYLALSLHTPGRLVSTLAVALAAALLCRVLSGYLILYGRRRFGVQLLLAFLLSALLGRFAAPLGISDVIGVLIPGILAREIDRQGVRDALLAVGIVTAATALLALLGGYPLL
ncbi:MAG: poly-gamma-glutamate biosynthesis protein PgsC [Oscillospiraceae bacterium]|nr:poly-gamma-glutamate biosynthesis protein PgsC [Oscillospiraceae bacterium]